VRRPRCVCGGKNQGNGHVMNTAEVMAILLPLIVRFEGLRLKPYLCSAGVATLGLGSTRYLDGRPVTLRDPSITREHAYALAEHQIRTEYLPAVLRLCPGLDTPRRVAAVTSFTYNCGTSSLRASTMRKRINAQDWQGAQTECLRWDRAAGRRVRGLAIRRAAEAAMLA